MPAKNEAILHIWDLGDSNTGLDGNMTATLEYYASNASKASASETVTITEIGTGSYAVEYTPESAGTYKLVVTESSLPAETWWEDIVSDAPSTAQATDAYCTEADVTAWAQRGDYTASTIPTETQVLTFMQTVAATIRGWMAEVIGDDAPGPASYSTSIDTSTDAGLALSNVCKKANAIGAAVHALEASATGDVPARSERVAELFTLFNACKQSVQDAAKAYDGTVSHHTTHVSSGYVTVPSHTSYGQPGLEFDSTTEF